MPTSPDYPNPVVIVPAPPEPLPSRAVEVAAAAIAHGPQITVAEDLRGAHAIVREWIAQDAEARREHHRNGWGTGGLEDLTTPLARWGLIASDGAESVSGAKRLLPVALVPS